jgi:hypothetical protein
MERLLQNTCFSDIVVEDEIDQALNVLPLIAPPATLVDNIMAAVAQLPLPQVRQPASLWDHMDILNVSLDSSRLS